MARSWQPPAAGDKLTPFINQSKMWRELAAAQDKACAADFTDKNKAPSWNNDLKFINDTDKDFDECFGVFCIGGPFCTPDQNKTTFKNTNVFRAKVPTDDCNCEIGVYQTVLGKDAVEDAIVSGLTRVQIDVKCVGHNHAKVIPGRCDCLQSTCAGQAKIVWLEKQGQTGKQWAVVKLGVAPPNLLIWTLTSAMGTNGAQATLVDFAGCDQGTGTIENPAGLYAGLGVGKKGVGITHCCKIIPVDGECP